jgi:hypothetical protein
MNCAYDKEKLTGYYDGELGAAEKAEVERHIASCSECLRDLGELKSAALLVRDLPRLRAPKSIAEGVTREVRAAGKVHVFSRVRRTVLWASAAAAGLFVVMNVMYFSAQKSSSPPGDAVPMARSIAKMDPMAPSTPPPAAESHDGRGLTDSAKRLEADREQNLGRRAMEPAPSAVRQEKSNELAKPAEELRKADDESVNRKKVLAAAKEGGEAKPGAAPAPALAPEPAPPAAKPPPAPAPVAKPAADMPAAARPEAKQEPLAEKAASKRELDAAPKGEAELKAKVAATVVLAEPAFCNVVSTQIAKTRTRLDESLKAMGVTAQTPAPQPVKAPRGRDAENTIVVELTDSQMARLREELEKPGDTRLVVTSPVDPVLPAFKSGGLFGKKDVAASGGAKPAPFAKDKDAKEAESAAPAAGKGADLGGAPEQRRKVTLHLVEAKSLPAADADDRTKK